jgi:activator of HSP90 ATPase
MESTRHAEFTGAPAAVDATEGGAFSCHDGQIVGRTIELVAGERIVQAWRVAGWEPGLYTLVKIELSPEAGGTRLVLDQSGVPTAFVEHLDGGWHARYWKPLAAHFA